MANFSNLIKEIHKYDEVREKLIKKSREVLRLSKQLIYSVHRNNLKESNRLLSAVMKEKSALDKIACHHPRMVYEGSYSEAIQEFVEAVTYLDFVKKGAIPARKKLNVSPTDYLMGICDLTGELTRRAVNLAAKREFVEVRNILEFVSSIQGEFFKLDMRNGNLRKKADQIKWNLKKLEEVVYDIQKQGC